jgi:hypothetical protein
MPTHHEDVELTAGDNWTISGDLTDVNGDPLDLSDVVTIQWIMLGPDGLPCLPAGSAAILVVNPPTLGQIQVVVPSSVTKLLEPGRYYDALRVILPQEYMATVWTGSISVDCNAFDVIDNPPLLN